MLGILFNCFSPFFFETGFLIELEVHQFGNTDWPTNSRDFSFSSSSSVRIIGMCHHTRLLHGYWKSEVIRVHDDDYPEGIHIHLHNPSRIIAVNHYESLNLISS